MEDVGLLYAFCYGVLLFTAACGGLAQRTNHTRTHVRCACHATHAHTARAPALPHPGDTCRLLPATGWRHIPPASITAAAAALATLPHRLRHAVNTPYAAARTAAPHRGKNICQLPVAASWRKLCTKTVTGDKGRPAAGARDCGLRRTAVTFGSCVLLAGILFGSADGTWAVFCSSVLRCLGTAARCVYIFLIFCLDLPASFSQRTYLSWVCGVSRATAAAPAILRTFITSLLRRTGCTPCVAASRATCRCCLGCRHPAAFIAAPSACMRCVRAHTRAGCGRYNQCCSLDDRESSPGRCRGR